MDRPRHCLRSPLLLAFAAAGTLAACSNSNSCPPLEDGGKGSGTTGGSINLASVGGAISGPVDNHCWTNLGTPDASFAAQVTIPSSCAVEDAGMPGPLGSTYGAFEWNASGNDDDCKYSVSWTSTPIVKNTPVTFFVSLGYAFNGAPVTGLGNSIGDGGQPPVASCGRSTAPELYFEVAGAPDGGIANHVNDNPTLAAGDVTTFENPPGSGVYQIGPAAFFDESGLWYVRIHLNENCCDVLPDSPHGHAAFYVNVP